MSDTDHKDTFEQYMKTMAAPRAFVRVYRLPAKLTDGYCFGGGVPIQFVNVDWFEHPITDGREKLEQFIRSKMYFHHGESYLVLSGNPDFTFVIGEVDRLQSSGKYA